jgi:hypothetical protein
MTHEEWLQRMRFPRQWTEWGLIPAALAAKQLAGYASEHEASPEHDRHGAFQWWLRQSPSPAVLVQLARLTWLDPDQEMGAYVRECIRKQSSDPQVSHALANAYEA